MNVYIRTNEKTQCREILYQGEVIESFSVYDDYAYTKANKSATKIKKMSNEKFKETYPEFLL